MSVIRETCGCGATWEGASFYRAEADKFRQAHAACRSPQPSSNEEKLREALQGFLDAWLNCDRKLTEADWEEMDEAERDARAALQEETP